MSAVQKILPGPVAARRRSSDGARTLLSCVQPQPGESLFSLVAAAAAANRLPTIWEVLGLVGAPSSKETLHGRPDLFAALARLIVVDTEEIAGRAYGPAALQRYEGRTYFGNRVPADWVFTLKRLAPGVAAVPSRAAGKVTCGHSAAWDLALLDACPDTGVKLVDRCPRPTCRRRLEWTLSNVATCSACGLDLAAKGERYAERVSEELLGGVRFVADLLCPWREAAGRVIARLPEPLRLLAPTDLVHLALLLTELAPEAQYVPGKKRVPWNRSRRNHMELAAAVEIMDGWPGTLHAALDRLRTQGTGQGRWGVRGCYGERFASFLRRLESEPTEGRGDGDAARRSLLNEIVPYVSTRQDVAWRKGGVLGTLRSRDGVSLHRDKGLTTLVDAAHHTGWGFERLRRLVRSRPDLAMFDDGGGSGAPKLLHTKALLDIVTSVDESVELKDCSRQLGIARYSCLQLVTCGLLPRVSEAGVAKTYRGVAAVRVCSDGLRELLARLEAGVRNGRAAQAVTLKGAACSAVNCYPGEGWEQLMRGMLDGGLPYYRRGGTSRPGLPYVVDASELAEFLRAARYDRPLSNKAIAAELGLTYRTMLALAHAGIAEVLPGRGLRQRWSYPSRQIERLRAEILSTNGVAVRLGFPNQPGSVRSLANTLKRCGLRPIVGDDGEANHVWRTSEVDAACEQIRLAWRDKTMGRKRPDRLRRERRKQGAVAAPTAS